MSGLSKKLSDLIIAEREKDKEFRPIVQDDKDNLNRYSFDEVYKRILDGEVDNRTEQYLDESYKKTKVDLSVSLHDKINRERAHHLSDIPECMDDGYLIPTVEISNDDFEDKMSLFENKISLNELRKIFADKEIVNPKDVIRNLKLRYIPESLKPDYHKIFYGVDMPDVASIADIDRASESIGLIWNESKDDIGYEDSEFNDVDSESINAYYQKLDNLKHNPEWLKLAMLTNGNYVLPGYGTRRKSCGKYGVKGCNGLHLYNIRNAKKDDDVISQSLIESISSNLHGKLDSAALRIIKMSCDKTSCPKDYKKAIALSAARGGRKLWAYTVAKYTDESGLVKRKPLHGVISLHCSDPDYDLLKDPKNRSKIEKRLIDGVKRLGIVGGIKILHLYRFSKMLNKPYYSPHLHIVYHGWTESGDVKQFNEDTGLVFRQIKNKMTKTNTVETLADLKRLLSYLLSHAAISTRGKTHSLRYFGDIQGLKFDVEAILSKSLEYEKQSMDTVKVLRKIRDLKGFLRCSVQFKRLEDPDGLINDCHFDDLQSSKLYKFDDSLKLFEFLETHKIDDDDFNDLFMATAGGVKRAVIEDNAPIPKIEKYRGHAFNIMSIHYEYEYNEKRVKDGYTVAVFDSEDIDLCTICRAHIHPMTPINEIIPPEWLPDNLNDDISKDWCLDDSAKWRPVNNNDISKGIPYADIDGMVNRETGIALRSESYDVIDDHGKRYQDDQVLESLVRYAMKRVKDELSISYDTRRIDTSNYIQRLNDIRLYVVRLRKKSLRVGGLDECDRVQRMIEKYAFTLDDDREKEVWLSGGRGVDKGEYNKSVDAMRSYIKGLEDPNMITLSWNSELWFILTSIYLRGCVVDYVSGGVVSSNNVKSKRLDGF